MPTILQKAVTPQMSAAYLEKGFDRVAGFVVPAAEVTEVTSTQQLFELHGLGYEGTPFSPDSPIDVLHVPQPPTARIVRATGGTTDEQRKATGGPFLEPAPFTGTGLAETDGVVVSLSWIEHTRLSPGSRLWRFHPDRDEPELAGTYHGPAFGWQNHLAGDELHAVAPTSFVGPAARTEQGIYAAELTTVDDDGAPTVVTLVSATARSEEHGFTRTEAGTWAKRVRIEAVQSLFELHLAATWNGMPVRVVEQFPGPDQQRVSRIFALGLNADVATTLKMSRVEPGVYEANVPTENLKKVTTTQRFAKTWPRPEPPAGGTASGSAGAASGGPAVGSGVSDVTAHGDPSLAGTEHQDLYRRIARGIAAGAPQGSTGVRLLARILGNRVELAAQATLSDENTAPLKGATRDAVDAMLELRRLTYRPDAGAWFTLAATLDAQGKFSARFNYEQEPSWQQQPPAQAYAEDLRRFPRDEEHTPDWLAERLREAEQAPAEASGAAEQSEHAPAPGESDQRPADTPAADGAEEPSDDPRAADRPSDESSQRD